LLHVTSKSYSENIISYDTGDMFVTVYCKALVYCDRVIAEIQSLEALDVFGMFKESSLNSLAEVLTDRKVVTSY